METEAELIKKVRIERLRVQTTILELERRLELAYWRGDMAFVRTAETLIREGKELLNKYKIPYIRKDLEK